MRMHMLLLTMLAGAPAFAQELPEREGGMERFDYEGELNPGDFYAMMRVDVDKRGYPTGCRVIKSNMRSTEMRWRACYTIKRNLRVEPIMRDGVAVPGTVIRTQVVPGRRTRLEYDRQKRERKQKERVLSRQQ